MCGVRACVRVPVRVCMTYAYIHATKCLVCVRARVVCACLCGFCVCVYACVCVCVCVCVWSVFGSSAAHKRYIFKVVMYMYPMVAQM
jgi:hypothetical protein